MSEVARLTKERDEARERERIAVEALQYYADEGRLEGSLGRVARAALAKLRGET